MARGALEFNEHRDDDHVDDMTLRGRRGRSRCRDDEHCPLKGSFIHENRSSP